MGDNKIVIPGEHSEDAPLNPIDEPIIDKVIDKVIEPIVDPDKPIVDEIIDKVNENGDKVDEDGNIITDIDTGESTELTEGSQVDIDGVMYSIDKDGNAVDDKGVITYDKDKLTDLYANDDEDETPAFDINNIIDSTKIQINDDEGNPIAYENTTEGLNNYVEAAYSKGGKDAISDDRAKLYGEFPFLPNLLSHVRLGGDLKDFTKPTDYNEITIDEENANQLKTIIYKARTSRGEPAESIDRYYNYLLNSDTDNSLVVEEATRELKFLADKKADNDRVQQEGIANKQRDYQNQLNNYWGVEVNKQGQLEDLNKNDSVYTIIKNKKLKLGNDIFSIPDKIRITENNKAVIKNPNDFFKYLYEPVVTVVSGKRVTTTRDNIKLSQESNNRNVNNEIYDAFLRYVNYDKSQFINEQVKKNNVKRVIKLSSTRNKQGKSIKDNTTKRIIINS